MPTYEYKCDACGHEFEKFQSMTAAPVKTCPKCGKRRVKRLISSGAGLIFKGSGFYITDYRSDAYKNSAKGDSAAPAADGKSSGEGKPAGDGAAAASGGSASSAGSKSDSAEKKTSEAKSETPATSSSKSESLVKSEKPSKKSK